MLNLIKKLFYSWAYIDIKHTYKRKETYFWKFSKEIGRKNLQMIKSIAIIATIISIFIVISASTYFVDVTLRNVYIAIFVFEICCVVIASVLLQQKVSYKISNVFSLLYLIHMLLLGGYIGVVLSLDEPAAVYIVLLVVSLIIFIFPPILTNFIAFIITVLTLVASYVFKDTFWFNSDVINCFSTLILAILLGWKINKIRAEEAFAREQVVVLNMELEKISATDIITGLPNHRKFQESYYKMYANAIKAEESIGVIMIDLDNFKSYNDNYGHIEGDKCLNIVSTSFSSYCNEDVNVYRYGGEEFIVIVSNNACGDILKIAEGIRKSVQDLKIKHCFSVDKKVVTVSLGCAVFAPKPGDKPMRVVEMADSAMYRSKREGRNRVSVQVL